MMEQLWSLCKCHRSPVAAVVNQYMISYCHHSSKQQAGASEIQTMASKIFNSNKELEEDKTVSGEYFDNAMKKNEK